MTAAEHRDQCARAMRLARVELRNAAARFGAIANLRRVIGRADRYDDAADALDKAARAFVRAEELLADAEVKVKEAEDAAHEQRIREMRASLTVIPGGDQ